MCPNVIDDILLFNMSCYLIFETRQTSNLTPLKILKIIRFSTITKQIKFLFSVI